MVSAGLGTEHREPATATQSKFFYDRRSANENCYGQSTRGKSRSDRPCRASYAEWSSVSVRLAVGNNLYSLPPTYQFVRIDLTHLRMHAVTKPVDHCLDFRFSH